MSYHPEMDSLIVRIERDDEYIEQLAAAVEDACYVIQEATINFKE